MEKKLSYLSLALIILFMGIYLSRELTKSEYKMKLNQIEAIKDSLDFKMEIINDQLEERDSMLVKQIQASKTLIMEINQKIGGLDNAINSYETEIDEIINNL